MDSKLYFGVAAALAITFGGHTIGAVAATKIMSCGAITTPGAYELSKPITAAGNCLLVQAAGVTIDLAGFTLTGNGTGAGVISGSNVTAVRNGVITAFANAVNLDRGGVVENVQAISN